MPIDASIALGAKAPDQMQSLSSLMTAANGAQDLQIGAQKLQNNDISLGERQGLQQFMSNPQNYMDADGNVDIPRATQGIMKVAPTTGLPVVQGLLTVQKQHTDATSALSTLDDNDRTRIANTLAVLKPDTPPEVVHGTLDALDKAYKGRIRPMVTLAHTGYDAAYKQGPDAVQGFLAQATKSVLPQTTQQEMNTPAGVAVSDGQTSSVVSTKPGTAVPMGQALPGTTVTNKVGPSGLESVDSDAQGNKYVVSRTPSGAIVGTRPLDSATAGQPGAAPGPFRMPPGETDDSLKYWTNSRIASNKAAATVPDQQFNNNQIIKLANTATLGQDWHGAAKGFTGHFAAMPGATGGTIDYDKIEHFLALQQGTLAQQAGFNSDSSRAIADRQAGSAHGTAEGVKSIARTNRALATGTDLYNRGVENAIQSNGNSVFSQREFQQKWSHTLDFDALRLYDAVKNKAQDPEGVKETLKELGGVDSDRYKAALKRAGEMRGLITGQ